MEEGGEEKNKINIGIVEEDREVQTMPRFPTLWSKTKVTQHD